MDSDFMLLFPLGLSSGFVAGFLFLGVSRAIKRTFGLVGRSLLMH